MSGSSSVIPFRPRRTYLEACREQGVFQGREEMLAEIADVRRQLAKVKKQHTADVIAFGAPSGRLLPAAASLVSYQDRTPGRLNQILNAFEQVIGGVYAPLLKHLILHTDISGDKAESILAASLSDLKRQEEAQMSEKKQKANSRATLVAAVEKSNMRRRPMGMKSSNDVAEPVTNALAKAVARTNRQRAR